MGIFKSQTNTTLTNKLMGYQCSTSLLGRCIPVIFGRVRLAPNVIWTGGWTANQVNGGKGNKGKGGSQQYDYITNVLMAIGQGPVYGVYGIWRDKDQYNLAYSTERYLIPGGGGSYQAQIGGTGSSNWWVLNVGVSKEVSISYSASDYGNPSGSSGTVACSAPMQLVESSPGAGQYTLAVDSSGYAHYGFSSADAGSYVDITYSYQINNYSITGSPMTHLNLVLFAGNIGQDPWNYLANNSAFTSQALGYSELAYIGSGAFDLGSAGVIPNLNFEVQGRCTWGGSVIDCNPADVIGNILSSPLDGVLGWSTPSSGTGYGPVTISGICSVIGTTMQVLEGSLSGLSVGQQIAVDGSVFLIVSFDPVNPTVKATLNDTPETLPASVPVVLTLSESDPEFLSNTINCYTSTSVSGISPGSACTVAGYSGSSAGMNGTWSVLAIYPGSPNLVVLSAPSLPAGTVYSTASATGTVNLAVSWSAQSMQNLAQINGASLWLPLGTAPNGIGPGGQVYRYCAANGLFISKAYDQTSSARETLTHLLEIANSDAFWSEGLLKFGCYGDTTAVGNGVTYSPATQPIYDIDDTDMVCGPDEEPLSVKRPDARDVKNEITVEWTNRSADYSTNTLPPAQDASMVAKFGRRPESTASYPEIQVQNVAVAVQNTLLKRAVYITGAGTYELTLFPHFCRLDPMDLITITDPYLGFAQKPVRITRVEEDDDLCLKVTLEEFPWSCSAPTLYPSQRHSPTQAGYYAAPGHVNTPMFVNLPLQVTQGNPLTVGIALSGGENWGGAAVYGSTDGGNSYSFIGMSTGAATMGYLTATLAITPDPDTATNALQVNLTGCFGEMESYTQAQADADVSLIVADTEFMSYETATLLGAFRYGMTYLRRGVFGSQIAAHAIGAQFCVVDGGLFQYQYPASSIGQTVYFKFCSVNLAGMSQEDISQVTAYPFDLTLPPPAPTFGVEQSAIDPTVLQLTGLTFSIDPSNFAIATGTFRIYYVNPAADDFILASNLTTGATSVSLDAPGMGHATIASLANKYARFGEEIVLCGTPTGTTVPITRAQLGTTVAAWNAGASMLPVIVLTATVPFPAGLFSNPTDLNAWIFNQPLKDMVVVAVQGYCTNAFGDGAVKTVPCTNNADYGIPLDAPAPGAMVVTVYNVTNPVGGTFSIATGNVLYNVTATTELITGTLPSESADTGNTVTIKLVPGSTYDCIIQEGGGDTIDGSSSPITLTPAGPTVWSGIGN